MERLHLLISGRVQGVGFRYATSRQADTLGLRGWVRNLADGRVEAEFEGPNDRLDQMLDWCRTGPPFAEVCQVDTAWGSGEPEHSAFRVRG